MNASRMCMIIAVNPDRNDYDEAVQALRYGCIAKLSGPSVTALKAANSCLSSKCAKNGWSGKNCKSGAPAFVACVGACQSAA